MESIKSLLITIGAESYLIPTSRFIKIVSEKNLKPLSGSLLQYENNNISCCIPQEEHKKYFPYYGLFYADSMDEEHIHAIPLFQAPIPIDINRDQIKWHDPELKQVVLDHPEHFGVIAKIL